MGIHGLPVGSGMIEIRRRLSANTEKGREGGRCCTKCSAKTKTMGWDTYDDDYVGS